MNHRDDCSTSPGEVLAHKIRETQIIGLASRKRLQTVAGFLLLANGSIALPCQFTETDDQLRPQQIELPLQETQILL
jgi:hypothetical protein